MWYAVYAVFKLVFSIRSLGFSPAQNSVLLKLIDWLPDFKLRLKISPETNKPVLAAEVHSVFDIAWYTLAWMISEDPAPEDMEKHAPRKEGVITRCACCGEIFTARNRNQKYCKKEACVKSRKAKNAKDKRDRDRIAKAQMTK